MFQINITRQIYIMVIQQEMLPKNFTRFCYKKGSKNDLRKATELAVRTFRTNLNENGLDPEFESIKSVMIN